MYPGHFLATSDCTPVYIEKFRVLEGPACQCIVRNWRGGLQTMKSMVPGPAVGGIIIAYEVEAARSKGYLC